MLGIALVVQLAGRQPEVVYVHPSKYALYAEAASKEEETPRPERSNSKNSCTGGLEGMETPSGRVEMGRVEMLKCFEVPSKAFAKLTFPHEALCNQELYVEIDAGFWEKDVPHHPHSHLHLVSHPYLEPVQVRRSSLDGTKVQGFNTVFVVDSRDMQGRRRHLSELCKQLSEDISRREDHDGWLSDQVTLIRKQAAAEEGGGTGPEVTNILRDVFVGLSTKSYVTVPMGRGAVCCLSTFPMPFGHVISERKALLPLVPRKELLSMVSQPGRPDILRQIIDASSAEVSLQRVASLVSRPLEEVVASCEMLVERRLARFVDPFEDATNTRITRGRLGAVGPGDFEAELPEDVRSTLLLSEVLSPSSSCEPWGQVKRRLLSIAPAADVVRILEWLMARNMLVRLGLYFTLRLVRFGPGGSDVGHGNGVDAGLRKTFGERVGELVTLVEPSELAMLASRAHNFGQLEWMCRFTREVVMAKRDSNSTAFQELMASQLVGHGDSFLPADELLRRNSDIFIKYYDRMDACLS